jgi:hypothetical protein
MWDVYRGCGANSREAKDLGDGERFDKTRGKFVGLYPEGQVRQQRQTNIWVEGMLTFSSISGWNGG